MIIYVYSKLNVRILSIIGGSAVDNVVSIVWKRLMIVRMGSCIAAK